MKADIKTLKNITLDVIHSIYGMSKKEREEFINTLKRAMEEYHHFQKGRFPQEYVEETIRPYDLQYQDVQMELVHVAGDLSEETHLHEDINAIVVLLGEEVGLPAPLYAEAFLGKLPWFEFLPGDILQIPTGTVHGFTAKSGGSFYFLSVQSPWLLRPDGYDDYKKVNVESEK